MGEDHAAFFRFSTIATCRRSLPGSAWPGFSEHIIHRQAGDIVDAEVKLGGDIVMLGPVREDAFAGIVGAPGHGNRAFPGRHAIRPELSCNGGKSA